MRLLAWSGLLLAMSAGLLTTSCSDDDDTGDNGGGGVTPPVFTAEELNTLGWDSFAIGEYGDAARSFEDALDLDATLHEARLGLGWAQAYTGLHDDAVATFLALVDDNQLVDDARAGLAATTTFADPSQAISAAQAVLSDDPDYVFSRRDSFDYQDLYVIQALAHFALQQYEEAQGLVTEIETMNELPSSGLDPANAATWVVDGITYATYHAALAKVIEGLSILLATHVPGGNV